MNLFKTTAFVLLAAAVTAGAQNVAGEKVYRLSCGTIRGCDIWIVDGNAVRRDVYPEFLYGGNDQRYLFIPVNEVWIDQSIAAEEYRYTLEHEMFERSLMSTCRLSYADAHDSALVLEQKLRSADLKSAQAHESSLRKVRPEDCDGLKEIGSLPDSIILHNVYRLFHGTYDGIKIWIVDGAVVRRDIFPDFGFSGNDLAYRFIPTGEIWIDAQVSCEETEFSISGELCERKMMAIGICYDSAYAASLEVIRKAKRIALHDASNKPHVKIPLRLDREFGEEPQQPARRTLK